MELQIIEKLMPIALDELRKEKICLIEDIFKVRRICFGLHIPGHDHVMNNPAIVFDRLYDLTICQLEVELAWYSAQMSQRVRILAGFQCNEY